MMTKQYSYCVYKSSDRIVVLIKLAPSKVTKQCSYCVYNVVRPNSRPCYTDIFHDDTTIYM